MPTIDDIVEVNIKAIINQTELTPNATGRLWTVQNVDKIEKQFINVSDKKKRCKRRELDMLMFL